VKLRALSFSSTTTKSAVLDRAAENFLRHGILKVTLDARRKGRARRRIVALLNEEGDGSGVRRKVT